MSKSADKMAARLDYDAALRDLQIQLVNMQIWAMAEGRKIVILFEGRDASGKDGTIKRIVEHLAVRNTRVVALPKPSDRDKSLWWFQRYVEHLPAAGELVIFNRSWYNRTGVERVMGFSTPEQQARFLHDAPNFEHMLIEADITLIKIWLDIERHEQVRRLKARRTDPLKRLKVSAMDDVAEAKWCDYSVARNQMLTRTSTVSAPWVCVRAGHKKTARLNVIRHILHVIKPPKLAEQVAKPDPKVLFVFDPAAIIDGRLAP
jgi:polyphosphate kinase 2